jgi:hypothetical protein
MALEDSIDDNPREDDELDGPANGETRKATRRSRPLAALTGERIKPDGRPTIGATSS